MPVNDHTAIPLVIVISGALWACTAVTIATTWILFAFGEYRPAALMGFTAGVFAPAAATASVRGYLSEVSGLIRIVGGIARAEIDVLRSVD